jgi:hypothetical protein
VYLRIDREGAVRNLFVGGKILGQRLQRSFLLSSDLMQQLDVIDQAVSVTAETKGEKEWNTPSSDRASEPHRRTSLLFSFSILAIT